MSAQPESPLAAVWSSLNKIVGRLVAVESADTVADLGRRLNEAERRLNELERTAPAEARGGRRG